MGKRPQFVDYKIPQQYHSRCEYLHEQVIEIRIFYANVHNHAVNTSADNGYDQKLCQRLAMPLVTLKGKMVVENVIGHRADHETKAGGNDRVDCPELYQHDQNGIVSECADNTDSSKAQKLADRASVFLHNACRHVRYGYICGSATLFPAVSLELA